MARESLEIIFNDIEDDWPSIPSSISNTIPWELFIEDGTVAEKDINNVLSHSHTDSNTRNVTLSLLNHVLKRYEIEVLVFLLKKIELEISHWSENASSLLEAVVDILHSGRSDEVYFHAIRILLKLSLITKIDEAIYAMIQEELHLSLQYDSNLESVTEALRSIQTLHEFYCVNVNVDSKLKYFEDLDYIMNFMQRANKRNIFKAAIALKWNELLKKLRYDEFGHEFFEATLFYGARINFTEACKIALSRGVPVDASNKKGWTALQIACASGSAETTQMLLKEGASITTKISNNPENKIEIWDYQGLTAVDVMRGEVLKLFEQLIFVKVVVVGAASIGKTTFVKRIRNAWNWLDKFMSFFLKFTWRKETYGIDMHSWKANVSRQHTIHFSLWDFAGQTLYYSSHQFFLSENSINLIFFDITKKIDENDILVWMNSIKASAKYSKVVFVATFIDKYGEKELENVIVERARALNELLEEWKVSFSVTNEIDFRFCKRKHSRIPFFPISATRGDGLQELGDALKDIGTSFIAQSLDKWTIKLKEKIEAEAGKMKLPLVNLQTFHQWVKEIWESESKGDSSSVSEKFLQERRKLLHNLGVVLDYTGRNNAHAYFTGVMNDKIIVRPQWLSDLMKTVINNQNRHEGILTFDYLRELWEPILQNSVSHQDLIHILKKFDIIAKLPTSGEKWVVPSAFMNTSPPKEATELLNKAHSEYGRYWRTFIVQYLPPGAFARIYIAVLNNLTNICSTVFVWKNGLLVTVGAHKYLTLELKFQAQANKPEAAIIELQATGNLEPAHLTPELAKKELKAAHDVVVDFLRSRYPLLTKKMRIRVKYLPKNARKPSNEYDYLEILQRLSSHIPDCNFLPLDSPITADLLIPEFQITEPLEFAEKSANIETDNNNDFLERTNIGSDILNRLISINGLPALLGQNKAHVIVRWHDIFINYPNLIHEQTAPHEMGVRLLYNASMYCEQKSLKNLQDIICELDQNGVFDAKAVLQGLKEQLKKWN